MNRTIQASLDAYRALGQQAPRELQKVASAIQAQQKTLQQPIAPSGGAGGGLLNGLLGSLPGGGALAVGGLAAGAAAAGAAIGLAAKQALDYADSLTKMSDRTGIGIVALQRLEAVALASGNSLEDITGAVNQFQKRLVSGDIDGPIRRLGLSVSELRAQKPDEQFIAIAKAIQTIKDPAEQTRVAMELFGRSGAQLLPSLKADVDKLADSTVKMSEESARALDDFGDALGAAKQSAVAFIGELAGKTIQTTLVVTRIIRDIIPSGPKAPPGFVSPQEGASFAETPRRFGVDFPKIPTQEIKGAGALIVATAEDAQRLTEALLGTSAAQLKAADAALRHQQALEAVNDKIRELSRPVVDLTAAQQDLVLAYQALGLSNQEIALKMGSAVQSLDAFDASLQDLGARFIDNQRASAQAQAAIGRLDLGYIKAKNSATLLQRGTLALTAAQAAAIPVIRGLNGQLQVIDTLASSDPFEKFSKHFPRLQEMTDRNSGTMAKYRGEIAKTASDGSDGLDGIARSLAQLSQISGGALGGLVQGLSRIVGAADAARKSIDSIKNAGKGFDGLLDKISGGIGLAVAAIDIGKQIFDVFHKTEAEKIAHDIGRDLGTRVSQGTTEGIKESEKELRDAFAKANGLDPFQTINLRPSLFRGPATALHLDEIIGDKGGVAKFGFQKAIQEAHDLFSIIQDGNLTIDQVSPVFDRVFGQIVPEALARAGKASQLVASDFVELQQTAIAFGTTSRELDKFRSGQIATVSSGLGTVLQNSRIQSQAAASGIAGAFAAAFGELQRQGTPLLDIFHQLGPPIAAFQQQLDQTGFSGGEAFDQIRGLAALASDEIAGPALSSVQGLQQVLAGLANIGGLNAETFSGLTDQIGATFRSLVDQGKDADQILRLMAPSLQTIFELQQRTGFAVDETTANLIAQAKAQGLVGDQFKSASERQVDGLNRVATILEAIADKLGADLPEAARAGASGVNQALDRIDTSFTIDIGFDIENPPDLHIQPVGDPVFASRGGRVTAHGLQYFGDGGRVLPFLRRGTDTVPAMLTPGEVVLSAAQQGQLADAISGVSVGAINLTVMAAPGDDEQALADKATSALRTNARFYQAVAEIARRQIAS